MSYYSAKEMEELLIQYPLYQEKLYCRGFLITDYDGFSEEDYPFYNNWFKKIISNRVNKNVSIWTHKLTNSYVYSEGDYVHFLIGHAYNPYSMEYREQEILKSLSVELKKSEEAYWNKESELTGVFCIGYLCGDSLVFATDCAGMQLIYYGEYNQHLFITSHSKIVSDEFSIPQDDYIVRLVNSRFYKYWGTFLPGDVSPYRILKRVVPNHSYHYSFNMKSYSFERFFPKSRIDEIQEKDYEDTILQIADVLQNSMELASVKWPGKRAAISLTGGKDSTMTLACAKNVYDNLSYFSYISNEAERVDAEAAHVICNNLGLEHVIYKIPDESELYKDIEVLKKIFECNAGCIGHNNLNDVKKRLYLDTIDDFDVEIKSWVDELSRGEAQNKYETERFPKKPSPGYYRCMWKVIANPRLIGESNSIFQEYLEKYYDEKVLSYLPWMDYFFWEFSWSAGEGMFLTSEHKYSDEISVPYNNRSLLNTMFTIPLEKRLHSQIQIDVIRLLNKKIEDSNVSVHNLAHTKKWAFMIRSYLRIFSKFSWIIRHKEYGKS